MSGNRAPIRVVIVDDHPAFRMGLRRILESDKDICVVGEGGDGAEALRLVQELRPEILLLDVFMPDLNGFQVVEQLSSSAGPMRTVFVTVGIDRKQLLQALQLGVRGLILKDASPSIYPRAIRCVSRGEMWLEREVLTEWALTNSKAAKNFGLTRRELDIIREISKGSSNKQIAETLHISEVTVKSHLTSIYGKLSVTSRLELSILALHHHILA